VHFVGHLEKPIHHAPAVFLQIRTRFAEDHVFQTFPLGEDLIGGAVGGLVLGLGVGLMVAPTIR
jgi:hypothetical protein